MTAGHSREARSRQNPEKVVLSVGLIAGDRDGGRRFARVPGRVCGAHHDRIVTAISIIPVARGLQLHGEGIAAVRPRVTSPLGWT